MHGKHALEELETMVQLDKYDLITVIYMWWDESHNWTTEIEDYKLFRRDRQGRRSRGVALYIREWKDCKGMPLRNSHGQAESLWVKVNDQNNKGHLVVGAYYRLSDQGEPVDKALLLQPQEAWHPQALMGEAFNHLDIYWKTYTAVTPVFKKGRKEDQENYRLVSLTSPGSNVKAHARQRGDLRQPAWLHQRINRAGPIW